MENTIHVSIRKTVNLRLAQNKGNLSLCLDTFCAGICQQTASSA